jgi:hypothetical protein
MKIKNIFKKTKRVVAKANVQKLEKNQVEKVTSGKSVLITNQWSIN